MVVMPIVAFGDQLKSSRAIMKMTTLNDTHLFQQMHGPIYGSQIALLGR